MESTPLLGDHPAILQFLLNISFDNACKGLKIVQISHLGEGFDLSRQSGSDLASENQT